MSLQTDLVQTIDHKEADRLVRFLAEMLYFAISDSPQLPDWLLEIEPAAMKLYPSLLSAAKVEWLPSFS